MSVEDFRIATWCLVLKIDKVRLVSVYFYRCQVTTPCDGRVAPMLIMITVLEDEWDVQVIPNPPTRSVNVWRLSYHPYNSLKLKGVEELVPVSMNLNRPCVSRP